MIANEKDRILYKNSTGSKMVFILTILASVIWFIGRSVNVYQYAITGAIFEMIWLPVIASFIAVPIIALLHFRKQGFHINSLYFYAVLVVAITIGISLVKY